MLIESKNLSPRQLAALTAFLIALPIAIVFFIIEQNWLFAIACFVVVLLGSFSLVYYILERFIYRKIKLIYRFIYQTKATKREEYYYKNILPKKSIDEVREDVEKWAIQRRAEIEGLQANESFRKEFLQNLSHELKTPLFAIQGYVDALLNGALENSEVNKKFLENADRNVDRLVSLVGDLDEISKLESGQLKLNFSKFNIHELIKDVYDSLSIKASDKGIKCRIKKGYELPLSVVADKEKIRQVLVNLIDNAIKYGKEGGIVEASVFKIDDNTALIEISDDGAGISEEQIPRVFERFYRTDIARSRKVGGSGLGLAICKHIVEAHLQTIHVRSKLDVGTTFGFTIATK